MYTRQNVFALGGDWADPILWYARGVAAMRTLALNEPTSWAFYGAIHGINAPLWRKLGLPVTPMPSPALQKTFWSQCQHQTWYFLPWHRGYLLAFEANVRAQIVKLGGPSDWALPYWNYLENNADGKAPLPPAFASEDWPDGKGTNPLFTEERFGPQNNGQVYVPVTQVNLDALSDPDFTGVGSGGSSGFGGVDTGFSHSGAVQGGIENQPHNAVHSFVGGEDSQNRLPGLMSDPDTAAYDPIFWLHHANLDRLWQVWRENPTTDVDPTDPNWLKGPVNVGERAFAMPMPDGTTWNYTPADMSNLESLGYTYDDLSAATPVSTPAARLETLGFAPAIAQGAPVVKPAANVEMVGANKASIPIQGSEARSSVQLDATVRRKVAASLSPTDAAVGMPHPDRVFLNLENVRGNSDATAFDVYVGLPEAAAPAAHPEFLAGTIGLFGVRKASLTDGDHGGQGLTYVLEITKIVDLLHLSKTLDVDELPVRLVPTNPVLRDANITVGRISIYRQGA